MGVEPPTGRRCVVTSAERRDSRVRPDRCVRCPDTSDRAAFYGWTNIWLERLGADSSEPFTIHEFEHISIAVVFAFAGTLGLLLESSRIRRTISAQVASVHPDSREPASYAFGSFSPIPALVIVVCGLSMAARASYPWCGG